MKYDARPALTLGADLRLRPQPNGPTYGFPAAVRIGIAANSRETSRERLHEGQKTELGVGS